MKWIEASKQKLSNSIALPDPNAGSAEDSSVPQIHVANKPTPGQHGPKGISPRTSYSRVNTGDPPTPEAGAQTQKSLSPRGMEFLPAKTAEREDFMGTSMIERPTLQEMLKAAMDGTVNKVDITNEAARQLANHEEPGEKTAEATKDASGTVHYSTEFVDKLADAVGFIATKIAAQKPGEGPGALHVMQATSSSKNVDAGEQGSATSAHQVPKDPPMQKAPAAKGDPSTGLKTNIDMKHSEQPTDPMHNEKAKISSEQNLERLSKVGQGKKAEAEKDAFGLGTPMGAMRAGTSGLTGAGRRAAGGAAKALSPAQALAGEAAGHLKAIPWGPEINPGHAAMQSLHQTAMGGAKAASAPISAIRAAFNKVAEDAINPAQISAGAAVPPDASASEQGVPSQPSDVKSQMALVGSNQAAINYTKGQAKADPKKDVNKVLTEPALSAAHDKTLQQAFVNTGKAGVKISSAEKMAGDVTKIAAARALLSKLAAEVAGKKKEKESMLTPTPQGHSGFTASSMGAASQPQ